MKMLRLFLLIACLAGPSYSAYVSDYLNLDEVDKAIARGFIEECYTLHGINEAIYDEALLCNDFSDTDMQEFLRCYFKKYTFMTEEDEIYAPVVEDGLSTRNYAVVEDCILATQHILDANEKTGAFYECFVSNFRPDICRPRP